MPRTDVTITQGKETDDSYSAIINIDLINTDGTNPVIRTSKKKLKMLRKSIETNGVAKEVHLVHQPPKYVYIIADGHRRVAISKELQYPYIRARIHTTGTPTYWWSVLNGDGTEIITGAQWMEKYVNDQNTRPPKTTFARIKRTIAIFGGIAKTKKLIGHFRDLNISVSPEICNVVDLVHSGFLKFEKKLVDIPSKKQTALWMLEHKEQQNMRRVVEPLIIERYTGSRAVAYIRRVRKCITTNTDWDYSKP